MDAIQFETEVIGDTIRIPAQYRKSLRPGKVQVTVLFDGIETSANKTKAGALSVDDFTELRIDTRGFKFDREEANRR